MGMAQVEKLEAAAQVYQQQLEEEGRTVPDEIRFWLISTGGFTQEVLEYAGSRGDMYASDYEGINSIFKAFGSNYSIPIFTREE